MTQSVRAGKAIGGQGLYVQTRLVDAAVASNVADLTLAGSTLLTVSNPTAGLILEIDVQVGGEALHDRFVDQLPVEALEGQHLVDPAFRRRGVLLALRSVLHALRDRLPPDEAVELAAQLPLLIKGVYFDGWNPSATPVRIRSAEEFFARVLGPFQRGLLHADVERITRSVFKLLAERVSPGEIRDVRGALPAELAQLWPEPAGAR